MTPESPKKAKLPTRSRLSIHQQHQQLSLPYYSQHNYYNYYSPRLLFSLGIVQLLSGVALVFLSLVAFRIDRERALSWSISIHYLEGVLPEVLRIIWLGAWISTSALLTLLATFKPSSALLQIVLFLTALCTIAITGAFVILISNHVLQNSLISSIFSTSPSSSRELLLSTSIDADNSVPGDEVYSNLSSDSSSVPDGVAVPSYSRTNGSTSPAAYFHIFIICLCLFCTLSFVISIISCSIVSHHLCSCRRPFYCGAAGAGSKYLAPYQIYNPNGSSSNTWSKKQRIASWVMQQSQQQLNSSAVDHQPSSDVPVAMHHQQHYHPNQHQEHSNQQNYHHRSQQHLVVDGPSAGSSSSARKKLSALQSMTSSSTKLSLYDVYESW